MATVLVIDDDEDVTRLLETQLGEEGHTVLVAHQGDEGMAKALKSQPDLIMLDVFLPDSTGFQICGQLRKHAQTHSVPIIMMTGAARFPSQQLFGMERGANEYIAKPFDLVEVTELVHKYLKGRGQQAPAAAAKSESPSTPLNEVAVETKPPAARKPQPASEDLAALTSFWQQSLKKKAAQKATADHSAAGEGDNTMDALKLTRLTTAKDDVIAALSQPRKKPLSVDAPTDEPPFEPGLRTTARPESPAEQPVVPDAMDSPVEPFSPGILASRERFVDFSLEIFALANRMSSTRAEEYLAEQLLRTSMSVAAKIGESRFTESKADFMAHLSDAMRGLRETAYWLMLARKAGLLEVCSKSDLEKTCQSLMTLLNDFVASERKRLARP